MYFERHFILKMHKIIFFPENLKKFLGFTSKFRQGQVTLNTGIFSFGLIKGLHCTIIRWAGSFILTNPWPPGHPCAEFLPRLSH